MNKIIFISILWKNLWKSPPQVGENLWKTHVFACGKPVENFLKSVEISRGWGLWKTFERREKRGFWGPDTHPTLTTLQAHSFRAIFTAHFFASKCKFFCTFLPQLISPRPTIPQPVPLYHTCYFFYTCPFMPQVSLHRCKFFCTPTAPHSYISHSKARSS